MIKIILSIIVIIIIISIIVISLYIKECTEKCVKNKENSTKDCINLCSPENPLNKLIKSKMN